MHPSRVSRSGHVAKFSFEADLVSFSPQRETSVCRSKRNRRPARPCTSESSKRATTGAVGRRSIRTRRRMSQNSASASSSSRGSVRGGTSCRARSLRDAHGCERRASRRASCTLAARPGPTRIVSLRRKDARLPHREPRPTSRSSGGAVTKADDGITGNVSLDEEAGSRRRHVHAGTRAGQVADEVAEPVLCAALEQRRTRIPELRFGHTGLIRAVIGGYAGEAGGAAGADESPATLARARSWTAASRRWTTQAGESWRTLNWIPARVAHCRARRDEGIAAARSP